MKILNKAWSFLISMKLMILLVVIFATGSAIGTFIENDHGRDTAWALVYGAFWFELIQILLGVNLVGNILRFRLYTLKKMPSFIFHTAFLVILIGAGITRYYGYEGVLHIREGASENRMLSADALLQIGAVKNGKSYYTEKPILLSSIGGNSFEHSLDVNGKTLSVRYKGFIKEAAQTAVEDKNGNPIVVFAIPTEHGPEKYFLQSGEFIDIGPFVVYFDNQPKTDKEYIRLFTKDDKIYFVSNTIVRWYKMADMSQGFFEPDKEYEFNARNLYIINEVQLATKAVLAHGVKKVISQEEYKKSIKMEMKTEMDDLSALIVDVEYDGQTKEIALMGKGKRFRGYTENFRIGDADISLEWGSKIIELPFSIFLRDFVLEKYPGSMSPSSYESHVTLIDKKNNINEPCRIYMNHILDYGGYLFFQSSYDKDERGTILSVNHDPGKWPTYLGYMLLIMGMVLNLLNPNSRFGKLTRIKYDRLQKNAAVFIALFSALLYTQPLFAYAGSASQTPNQQLDISKVIEIVKSVDYGHAENFGSILVQGNDGRIKPLDTVNIDILNKVHGKSTMLGLSHNQIVLGMAAKPSYWQRIDMIKVKHPRIKKLLGIDENRKYFAYQDVFDEYGRYKISDAVNEALRKRAAERGTFEKELLKIDEKLNVAYMVYSGNFMKMFPQKNDLSNTWHTPSSAMQNFPQEEASKIQNILSKDFKGITKGLNENDWSVANSAVDDIKAYQQNAGATVIPDSSIIKMELFYNKYNIFEKLISVYLISGFVLLMLIFIRLTKPSLNITPVAKIVLGILILGFIAHTANLGARWYISGHAPWSDGYESLIYIAWSIILAGILFAKQSEFAISTTGILAGLTLFVAHLSWIDPQITNLVPVLKSYWLTIHVCVITASYGFLGLSSLLGFISLILFIIIGRSKSAQIRYQASLSIKEAARINEISMIVGLCLLTIGNFLGGVWANESWGRYWGWDPKETWALISILVYAAVVHMRFVPQLKSIFAFSVASTVSYSSIIMTYFGVNYYLSGLHSYASGDPIPVPVWIYYVIAVIGAVILVAFMNKNAFNGEIPKQSPR